MRRRAVGWHADAWVATASAEGKEHLVPLSIGWDGERVVLATEPDAVTTRNIEACGRARLAVGTTRDVVMIDAVLDDRRRRRRTRRRAIAESFAAQADWDPRHGTGLRASSCCDRAGSRCWREVDEIAGRTVMRDGQWTHLIRSCPARTGPLGVLDYLDAPALDPPGRPDDRR